MKKKKEVGIEQNWRDIQAFKKVKCSNPKGYLVFKARVPRFINDNQTTLFQTVYFVESS